MENLLNSLSSKGATLETDQSLRLPSRPVKQASTHLIGLAYEDLGTSLDSIPATQASKTRRKPTRRSQSILDDIVDSESEDEIDMLSQHDSDTDTRRTARGRVGVTRGMLIRAERSTSIIQVSPPLKPAHWRSSNSKRRTLRRRCGRNQARRS
ncbi:hypothetical protein BD779DRAFT_1101490 [Infundibulicybe gibba]|nr:hypothetical protein BD779DRAFT_1101490 [Infundibulicybe gibba]